MAFRQSAFDVGPSCGTIARWTLGSLLQISDDSDGRRVVRVGADKEVIIPVSNCRGIMLDHLANNTVFVPEWNEYRNGGFRLPLQVLFRRKPRVSPCGQPVIETDQIEQQIVE